MARNRKARRRAKQREHHDRGAAAVNAPPPSDDGARADAAHAHVHVHVNVEWATRTMWALLAAFAYLALVNLDWALFWDDEATMAYLARNWLELGAPLVDDGRNVYTFGGKAGRDIAADGTFAYPPLTTALYALAFKFFGYGETPARAFGALFSIAAMALFAQILRAEFPRRPWFCAVAFAFACFAPMTLGYARSATYNTLLLFFHMLLFWSYLQFCARRHAGWAALALAAALAGFHTQYLSSMMFVATLAVFHLLFRRRGLDRRAWIVLVCAGAAYAAQVLWFYFAEYSAEAYGQFRVTLDQLRFQAASYLRMPNQNGALVWTLLLWFFGRRAFAAWRAHAEAGGRRSMHKMKWLPADGGMRMRDDRVFQYIAFVALGTLIAAVLSLPVNPADRYISSFVPFGAPLAAAAVCAAWQLRKTAGAALAGLLLLTSVPAWPFLKTYEHSRHADGATLFTGNPGWTLPYLAIEYHREYRDSLREALEYLRAQSKQDDLVYSNYLNPGWMLWYFSDRLLVCCRLSRDVQTPGLNARGRGYLYTEDVSRGAADPDWLLLFARNRPHSKLRFRDGGPEYIPAGNFLNWHSNSPKQRPEPTFHYSFPNRTLRGGATAIRFYRRADG
ncbi:MAG: glycosyltransferase family 39 protein [Gammaproteobacteria bacterium]|nr:glycosyltransferase family 39 protein [Gammaproteobacteria bacterium]